MVIIFVSFYLSNFGTLIVIPVIGIIIVTTIAGIEDITILSSFKTFFPQKINYLRIVWGNHSSYLIPIPKCT